MSDILPTVLDVAGLPARPYDGPGSSVLSRLAKGARAEPVLSFSEADGRCWPRRGVVGERYKYIYTPGRPMDQIITKSPLFFDDVCSSHSPCAEVAREELYELSTDPFEERDQLKAPLDPEASVALERMRVALTTHLNRAPLYKHRLTVGGAAPDQLDDSTREALRALGYIQ